MAKRDTRGYTMIEAVCYDCEKGWSGRNAQGVAAQHSYRTGHEVEVVIERNVWYGPYDQDGNLLEGNIQ